MKWIHGTRGRCQPKEKVLKLVIDGVKHLELLRASSGGAPECTATKWSSRPAGRLNRLCSSSCNTRSSAALFSNKFNCTTNDSDLKQVL